VQFKFTNEIFEHMFCILEKIFIIVLKSFGGEGDSPPLSSKTLYLKNKYAD
jgi:hypothetical protein